MVFCGVRLQHGRGDLSRIRAMNPDRHIYLTTVVLAAVFATAINVLKPREPFAGTTMHRETTAFSRTAEATPAGRRNLGARTRHPATRRHVAVGIVR